MAKIFLICFSALLLVGSICAISVAQEEAQHQILDIDTPNVFSYSSPLAQPDSLRSRPYFDFLSTLYRHDAAKNDLFRPYQRRTREAIKQEGRSKRAIVFRPLFVYKQQEVKKKEYQERRKRRY